MERTVRSREFHVDGAAWAKPRVVICNETRGTDRHEGLTTEVNWMIVIALLDNSPVTIPTNN